MNAKLELTKPEIELLEEAIQCWEREPSTNGMIGSMFEAIITPKEEREARRHIENHMKNSNEETKVRRFRGVMIRAKLMQAMAMLSEHEVEA